MKPTADFLQQAQATIEKVVRSYRPILMKASGNIEHHPKADNSPVTKLDFEIETALKQALGKLDPNIGFEGEEHGKEGNTSTFWLIDPIDGTENFIRGLPFYRNMITLIDNDEPVFALVYSVAADELFIAHRGGGATCNGRPLHLSKRPLKKAWIELTANLADQEVLRIIPAIYKTTRGICLSRDFTRIPKGTLDGHLFYKSRGSTWDYAPWALINKEAGGRVANIGSDTYHYRSNNFLIANPVIFDDLMKLITVAVRSKR